ncbi:MAG TPA: flagellar biosynthesis protein FlhA [Fimbriimonadaceae bacterium]|nr:flagellar biosynthesis protein FlhA [Fimbriimonadaceae bacterium]HRJ33777.1 flagellar biosynthesis protein FlhA [Fimbriimonadaceae bacterium]
MNPLQRLFKHTDLMLGVGLLVIVAMLILPLPHWALDAALVVAIASSVIILLASVNADDPLKFSVFPSLLLITTLFRLALSIAATKLILGSGQAGQVIETFGRFIMGGDFVVGFVAFIILVIVQFVVITNGAGRVSEVVARFTLDAMPGKQMAIDADLAAGLINEEQARERRKQVKQEADFYGSMDGASKFIKGDAIAAILIIAVNIIGGIVVGFLRNEGDFMSILRNYALLSVGEGLVSQIPALLISTASGLLVTRAGQEKSMGGAVIGQMIAQPKAIGGAGIALCAFAFVPGFPAILFLFFGGTLIALYRYLTVNPNAAQSLMEPETPTPTLAEQAAASTPAGPETVLPLVQVDTLEIEIGYGLTKLADTRAGGDLPDRVSSTRRQLAVDLGYVMPSVRIRDSIGLGPHEYVIKVRGEEVAKSVAYPDQLLAIGGEGSSDLPGARTIEPVFGLPAVWIDPGARDFAERAGYTVVEPSAMMSTHLSEIVKVHAAELISRQDVFTLLEQTKQTNESLVADLVPTQLSLGDVQKVLQHLLRERVPIRDMVTILETLADFASRTKDPDALGELVRASIARTITRQYLDHENKLYCITLEPSLERLLTESLQNTTMGQMLVLEPDAQQRVMASLKAQLDQAAVLGVQPVVLCGNTLRLPLRRLLDRHLPSLHVLAFNEVSAKADVEFLGQVQAA